MSSFVLGFSDIDQTKLVEVGGKGANLGELARIAGISVPDGFCISTDAFKRIMGETPALDELLDRLSLLKAEEREKIAELSAEVRRIIAGTAIPQDIAGEISRFLSRLGEKEAYAVRSSATAEDLPTASFAGQQDTYLNISGKEAILKSISQCWASLFTERAVTYRLQNGFDHRKVQLAVVVQKMVHPQASGILFTADPVTGNRKVASIDAGFGLGEALVSGLVNPDLYKVRDGEILAKKISTKQRAVYALKKSGTQAQEVEPERQNIQTLTDEQILRLARLGRKIEAHFGRPQDIEWCLADDAFYIVQSRPITTLYPIPEASDQENHVYVSVGHQQMMTAPMKPLGLSFFLLTTPAPMRTAGGRLFVDVTRQLASPDSRKMLLNTMGQHDPLMRDALATVIERGDFIKLLPDAKKERDEKEPSPGKNDGKSNDKNNQGMPPAGFPAPSPNDPAIVADLMKRSQISIEKLKHNIQTESGAGLIDFIREDIQELKKILFDPQSSAVFMAAINASAWVNEKMEKWLREKNAADALSQSVPNNITAEMGLELLNVADAIRPYPEVVAYLQRVNDDDTKDDNFLAENFLTELVKFEGGQVARDAISAYLNQYGMRCAGEIDITKPRWSEKPTTLVPLILSNIKNFAPNAGKRRFEQGRREALQKEQELLERLRQLPDGEQKVKETK